MVVIKVATAEHRTLELEGEYNTLKQGQQADMQLILRLKQEVCPFLRSLPLSISPHQP